MKKTIKLAVVAALALGATSAFATNGSNLIGYGAKARGMGGVGIGMSHGAESALVNPALISSVKNTEVQFAGTVFMPNVKADTGAPNGGLGTSAVSYDSDADMNVIPAVSLASKITDNFYAGIGMWGTAGMGVDYRDQASNFNMVTNLQLMQFGVPLVYATNGFSIGVTPILQYGSLDIGFKTPDGLGGQNAQGAGVAQDLQFGYNIGAAYEVDGFTVGAVYKSQIDMDYKDQLSASGSVFGLDLGNKLSTPEEYGIGVSYNMSEHTIAVDYKRINWSKAKGYEDFAWEDQDVFIIGYEYATDGWAARVGYNYAKSPIKEQSATTTQTGGSINALNLLGFPATVESHITAGGTYNITEQTSVDLAIAYAPETTNTFTHTAFTQNPNSPVLAPITTKHSQTSVSLGLNYAF